MHLQKMLNTKSTYNYSTKQTFFLIWKFVMIKGMRLTESPRMIFILITMFLNFVGFSIIIPILPFLVERYVSGINNIALYVGLMLSVYALCQFLAAPGLGALSDRFGRRPILLISLFGSVIGYLFLGFGGSLTILFLGRIIDGLTGGNISTVYAYVADITEPQHRGKYYGILGAAGGFGFMVGPALGGFLATIHLTLPLFVAAGVTFANMLWGYFILPESLKKERVLERVNLLHLNPFSQFNHIFSLAILRKLFLSGFLFFLALNALYASAAVFYKDVFLWNAEQIGMLLFLVGVLDIFSQGFLVRKLLPMLGEVRVAMIGFALTFLGFCIVVITAIFPLVFVLFIGVILFNIGDGLFEPTISSLISNAVDSRMQGRVQGANQGMQSIARVLGPLFSAWMYQYWRGLPFVFDSLFVACGFVIFLLSIPAIKNHKVV